MIEEATGDSLEDRVTAALRHVEGTYGIAVMDSSEPGKIVAARRGSPVLLGVGDDEHFVASDASAVIEHTRSVVYLNDGDVATVTAAGHTVIDRDANLQTRAIDDIEWDAGEIERGGYPHFMLKEIREQPATIGNVMRGRLLAGQGSARLNGLNLTQEDCKDIRRIVIVACGSSWHAGLVGRHYIEQIAGIPVEVEYASEFRYRHQVPVPGTLTLAISQSGETADTLEAMRVAKEVGLSASPRNRQRGRQHDRPRSRRRTLPARGPRDRSRASTKSFTSQLVALLLFALYVGRRRGFPAAAGQEIVRDLERLPEFVTETLALEPAVKAIAEEYADAQSALYLGRGLQFPVAPRRRAQTEGSQVTSMPRDIRPRK